MNKNIKNYTKKLSKKIQEKIKKKTIDKNNIIKKIKIKNATKPSKKTT
ncbi:hypothetical protein ACJBPT_11295 [Streptococcus suis]